MEQGSGRRQSKRIRPRNLQVHITKPGLDRKGAEFPLRRKTQLAFGVQSERDSPDSIGKLGSTREACFVRGFCFCNLFLGSQHWDSLPSHDPNVLQETNDRQEELATGPMAPVTLQCPSTASSGRRLTRMTLGGS